MRVYVIGKRHMEGISKKSGKPYNNTVVYGTYDAYGVEGMACDTFWLSAEEYPLNSIEVGASYAVERTRKGFIINFDRLADK